MRGELALLQTKIYIKILHIRLHIMILRIVKPLTDPDPGIHQHPVPWIWIPEHVLVYQHMGEPG